MIGETRAPARLSCREPAARSRHRVPDVLARAATCRWPRTSTSRRRPTSDRRTDAWTSGRPTGWPSSTSTSRRPRRRGRSRSRSDSSSRSSRRCSPSRRCCSSTSRRRRSGPRTSTGSTRSCTSGAAPASGSSTSAIGCPRCLGIADRISVLRDGVCQGTFEAAVDVGGEPRRSHDRASAPARVSASDTSARRDREVLLAVSGLRGDRFGPIDLEVASGEILGIAGAEGNGQVQFLRALAGAERATGTATLRRQAARLELAARAASRGSRAAERRPRVRVALPGPERPGERDDPGAAAARTVRVPQPRPRAAHGRRPRPAPQHPNGVDRAARADALGRQPAEGLADATVPARRRQGHPRRGADAGRRRRRAVRHLRRAAREGEGRRRHDRQVERPARARRPLRPRRRDVARADRRRDPRRRARGTPDRRGDRRLAGRCQSARDRRAPGSRREDRQVQRRVAARPDDGRSSSRSARTRPSARTPSSRASTSTTCCS